MCVQLVRLHGGTPVFYVAIPRLALLGQAHEGGPGVLQHKHGILQHPRLGAKHGESMLKYHTKTTQQYQP